jgi:hypothetical protein
MFRRASSTLVRPVIGGSSSSAMTSVGISREIPTEVMADDQRQRRIKAVDQRQRRRGMVLAGARGHSAGDRGAPLAEAGGASGAGGGEQGRRKEEAEAAGERTAEGAQEV